MSIDVSKIELQDLILDSDGIGSYNIVTTNEIVDWLNQVRKDKGYTDLVGVKYDNDVYYCFYLGFDSNKKEVSIYAECAHGEKDDMVYYHYDLTDVEQEILLWKLVNELTKEI